MDLIDSLNYLHFESRIGLSQSFRKPLSHEFCQTNKNGEAELIPSNKVQLNPNLVYDRAKEVRTVQSGALEQERIDSG